MKLNTEKLHTDIIVKLNKEKMNNAEFLAEVGMSKDGLWRISKGKHPQIRTFIKIIEWLGSDSNEYIN